MLLKLEEEICRGRVGLSSQKVALLVKRFVEVGRIGLPKAFA